MTMRTLINLVESAAQRVTPEQAPALLYHGTSILYAAAILATNEMWPDGTFADASLDGVSLTWDKKRAAGYALESTWRVTNDFCGGWFEHPVDLHQPQSSGDLPDQGAILVFDGKAIARHFTVLNVSWDDHEAIEERVIGQLAPVRPYLKNVIYDPAMVPLWIKRCEANIGSTYESADNAQHFLAALRAFRP